MDGSAVDEGSKSATYAAGISDGGCAGSSSSHQPREAHGGRRIGTLRFRPLWTVTLDVAKEAAKSLKGYDKT